MNDLINIENKILVIRGQQVMLDYELAKIYGYETKRFNEQVKNNIERFDEDFMFQLTDEEIFNLRSKISTSSWGGDSHRLHYILHIWLYNLPHMPGRSSHSRGNINRHSDYGRSLSDRHIQGNSNHKHFASCLYPPTIAFWLCRRHPASAPRIPPRGSLRPDLSSWTPQGQPMCIRCRTYP